MHSGVLSINFFVQFCEPSALRSDHKIVQSRDIICHGYGRGLNKEQTQKMKFIIWPLAFIGLSTLILFGMLQVPLKEPRVLETIDQGARTISSEGLPEREYFQARDGTWLAYRYYPANAPSDRLAVLIHGSAGSSSTMNDIGKALSQHGVSAFALDIRGHGASGTRGDIAYLGQLEDDFSDFLDELHKNYQHKKVILLGHSSGGGFALRIAEKVDQLILLAPYLGYMAPTNREVDSAHSWVEVNLPRMFAIMFLEKLGITSPQCLPTIAFATAPEAKKHVTSCYTYRLMCDFAPPDDWQTPFQKAPSNIIVIAGLQDELMNSPAYKTTLEPLGISVTLLDGVDHMGVLYAPSSLAAICKAS
jgi:pimeloyl-ACP methyl ester carboxylesterase